MRLRTQFIPGLALTIFVFGVVTAKSKATPAVSGIAKAHLHAPRVECSNPRTLHLTRFEDNSAQLRCAHRILVRVSVPG